MKKGLHKMYFAFLSPVVIAFLIAYLYPVLRTVQMSFFEVSDISSSSHTWRFVGLYNYLDLFSRQLFRVSFRNMLLIFFVGGALVFLISLFFCLGAPQGHVYEQPVAQPHLSAHRHHPGRHDHRVDAVRLQQPLRPAENHL